MKTYIRGVAMASALELKQDITKNEKELETAKKQLIVLDDSLRSSSIRRNVLTGEIKKIEAVLKTKRHDHSHATAQKQQHADTIRTTEAALLKAPTKRQLKPQPLPLQTPANFLQTARSLQTDIHMHNYLVNEKGYKHSEGQGIYHSPDGKAHKLTKNNGKYQIEEQRQH